MSRNIEDFDCFWLDIRVTSTVSGSRRFCCASLHLLEHKYKKSVLLWYKIHCVYENLTFTSPELTSLPILVSFQGSITKVLRNSKLTQFRCVDRKKIQTILFLDALHTYSPETPPCPKHRNAHFLLPKQFSWFVIGESQAGHVKVAEALAYAEQVLRLANRA